MSTMPGNNFDEQGLPQPQAPEQQKKDSASGGGIIGWLRDSYNGIYRIVIAPSMPKWSTIILLIVGFLIGIIWGYLIAPTEFTGANPNRLNQTAQDQWVKMSAVGYDPSTRYGQAEVEALLSRIDNPAATVQRLLSDASTAPSDRDALQALARELDLASISGTPTPEAPSIISQALTGFVVPLLLILVVTPILFVAWRLLIYPNIVQPIMGAIRRRFNREERERYAVSQAELKRQREMRRLRDEMTGGASAGGGAAGGAAQDGGLGDPVMRQLSIYTTGRSYDDSFEIELPDGSFLGQCGATLSESLNGDPVAIEVWLFDMGTSENPVKVFMTEQAYNDASLRSRIEGDLDDPSDIVVANVGSKVTLDTPKLRLQGEMKAVEADANGRFANFQMTLFAWQKGAEPAPAPGGPPPLPPAAPLPDYSDMQFDPPPAPPSGQPIAPANEPATPTIGNLIQETQEETIPNDPLPPYRPTPFDDPMPQTPSRGQPSYLPPGMDDMPPPPGDLPAPGVPPGMDRPQSPLSPAGIPGVPDLPDRGQPWQPSNMPPPPGLDDDDEDDPFGASADFTPLPRS